MPSSPRRVAVILFPQFEPLDVFGPVEILGNLPDRYSLSFHAVEPGLVPSALGFEVQAPADFGEEADILFVPGGMGTRGLVHDQQFLTRLRDWGQRTPLLASVCTGSALLAASGLLDGHRATSNKRAFDWAASFGNNVEWVRQARWVPDGSVWTSSGVAAGMDMAAALVRHLDGAKIAEEVCHRIELEVQHDATNDSFA